MRVVTCVAVLLAGAGAARAQSLEPPRPRQGYYLGVGLGGASSVVWEEDAADAVGPLGGFAFALRAGQLLTRTLGLGIQLDLGTGSGDGNQAQLAGLGLQGQWEVAPNLAVRAGVGLGVAGLDDPDEEGEPLRGAVGAGYTIGLGYDWFVSTRSTGSGGWALVPAVTVRVVPGHNTALVTLFTLELTRWTGLPPNQLELPEAEAYRKRE